MPIHVRSTRLGPLPYQINYNIYIQKAAIVSYVCSSNSQNILQANSCQVTQSSTMSGFKTQLPDLMSAPDYS
jgi:hypothetical protein